jgi:hypothetical protein
VPYIALFFSGLTYLICIAKPNSYKGDHVMPNIQISLNNGKTLAVTMPDYYVNQLITDYSNYLEGESVPPRRYVTENPPGKVCIAMSAIQVIEASD